MISKQSNKVIDLHAHIVFSETMNRAGRFGPELRIDTDGTVFFRFGGYQIKPMDYRNTIFMDVDMRLEEMQRHGIDLQLLSPNPLTFFHHIPEEDAINFCLSQNDAMANVVLRHPDKFMGAAALPI